jgi:hypothetical protein
VRICISHFGSFGATSHSGLSPRPRWSLFHPLDLPRLSPEQGALDRVAIEVVAGELQLEHHFPVGPSFGPWRCQMLQPLWSADQEQAVGLHFAEPDLGRILPPGSGAGELLRLVGERSLSELLKAPHGATDIDPEIGIRQIRDADYDV